MRSIEFPGAARAFAIVAMCLCSLLPACSAPHQPRAARVTERAELPFKLVEGVPVVEARINGRGPYLLLIDTGAAAMRLREGVARELDLPLSETRYRSQAPTGDRAEMPTVRVERLEVGRAVFADFDAAAVEKLSYEGIDGVAGMEVMRGCTLVLDFPAQRITIEPGGTLERGQRFKDADPRVPLAVGEGGDRRETLAVVDSGFNGTVALTPDVLPRGELTSLGVDEAGTSAGVDVVRVVRIETPIIIGPATLDPPIAGPVVEKDTLIGMGVLKHCRVTVDLESNRVLLEWTEPDVVERREAVRRSEGF